MKEIYKNPIVAVAAAFTNVFCQTLSTDNPTDIPGTKYTGDADDDDEAGAKQKDDKLWSDGW